MTPSPPDAAPPTVDLEEGRRLIESHAEAARKRWEPCSGVLSVDVVAARTKAEKWLWDNRCDLLSRLSASEAALESALGMIDEMAQGWPTPNTYTERADSLRAALSVGGATGDGKGAEG